MRDKRLQILGSNIKAERVRKNLSQYKLADIISRSKDSIYKIENGTQTPSALLVFDIAKALNIPIEKLYESIS